MCPICLVYQKEVKLESCLWRSYVSAQEAMYSAPLLPCDCVGANCGEQSTVAFLIGDHGNILSDYNDILREIMFYLHRHCNHVTDMIIGYPQNHIPLALLKCKHVNIYEI